MAFNNYDVTQNVALDIIEIFLTGWSIVFFTKLRFIVFMARWFFLLSHFLVGGDHKLSKSTSHFLSMPITLEYVTFHLGPSLFSLIQSSPNDALCKVTIWADDTTLNSSYDKASDFLQQAEIDLSCNLVLQIKIVGKYFYFLSVTIWFWNVKIWCLKLIYSSTNIRSSYPEKNWEKLF